MMKLDVFPYVYLCVMLMTPIMDVAFQPVTKIFEIKLVWFFLISLHRESLSVLCSLLPKMVTFYSQKIFKNVPFRLHVSHVWHTKGSCYQEINENA